MRFFCMGEVVEWDDERFEGLLGRMGKERIEGARAVILLDVFKVRIHSQDNFGTFDRRTCRCKRPAASACLS